jgi:hypothetical protein
MKGGEMAKTCYSYDFLYWSLFGEESAIAWPFRTFMSITLVMISIDNYFRILYKLKERYFVMALSRFFRIEPLSGFLVITVLATSKHSYTAKYSALVL